MTKPAHLFSDTPFHNPRCARKGLDPMTLSELRARDSRHELLGRTERVQFFMMMLIKEGFGEHQIDFETLRLKPGTVVVVRPGEVQQWRSNPHLEGDLILVDPSVLLPVLEDRSEHPVARLLHLEEWPNTFAIAASDKEDWDALLGIIRATMSDPIDDDLSCCLARETFLCLMLRIARCALAHRDPQSTKEQLYRRLMRKLDEEVLMRPTVNRLAQLLNVSTSTLTRVCQTSVGFSAKEVIDRRVALEAQRLLVHSQLTAAGIGEHLGFTEPTNFLKFFKRQVGQTPENFRRQHHS